MIVGDSAGSSLAEAMNRLWVKYFPQMRERVVTLQNAAASVAQGTLSEAEQHQACADAHKLAGVLGMFGLQDGTELAREAEAAYGGMVDGNPDLSERLSYIAQQLNMMILSRQ